MPNIKPLDPAQATGDTAKALDSVKAKLGAIPNLIATIAQAPAALQFYLKANEGVAAGRFTAKQRELIAIGVADANACAYCLSAHTAIGGMVGLQPTDLEAARDGHAANPRDAALITLARRIVLARGHLDAADLTRARNDGLSDADILETIALVALNVFTNYVNHIAGTEIDFPPVALRKAA